MPKIIITSRYLKGSTQTKNLVKYMATREGSQIYTPQEVSETASEKQIKLIQRLLNRFPESKNLFEYQDFTDNPSVKNANELISEIIERNADMMGSRSSLVSYMAERPGVQKLGEHGLFSDTNTLIYLNSVMAEVESYEGNIWSHVVSLKREDAERLHFNTPEAWRKLLLRHIDTIATATNIKVDNLKWYAAYHDKAHHPHIHLIIFSKDPKQKGFLTNEGIEQIKSKLVNDIFHDELAHLYQKQTQIRDRLRQEAKEIMKQYLSELESNEYINPKLQTLLIKLHEQLNSISGKKVYGYLPKTVKATVDEILSELVKHPTLSKMYSLWCELEQEKYSTYSDVEQEIAPIEKQNTFKPIKNAILKAALELTSIDNEFQLDSDEIVLSDIKSSPKSVLLRISSDNPNYVILNKNMNLKARLSKTPVSTAFSLLRSLGRLISDDYNRELDKKQMFIDSKLRQAVSRQKEAIGVKEDYSLEQKY